jgi:hypothetical protein
VRRGAHAREVPDSVARRRLDVRRHQRLHGLCEATSPAVVAATRSVNETPKEVALEDGIRQELAVFWLVLVEQETNRLAGPPKHRINKQRREVDLVEIAALELRKALPQLGADGLGGRGRP